MRSKVLAIFSVVVLTCALQMFTGGCGPTQRDRIANAERTLQGAADAVTILAPKIKDPQARAAIASALDEALVGLREAVRRDAAGETLDDAFWQDRFWSALNRALTLYAKAEAEAQKDKPK